jgi:uncharacterized protein (DUF58 family)
MIEARAFEPDFLRRLDRLVLGIRRSRTVRIGQRQVERVQGMGIEPENFKEYVEGDDLRFLDWNAYARLDELTIRTYRAERQVEVTVMVDRSASMGLPERDDKLGLALALGASLAYVAMAENDAVRLAAFAAVKNGARLSLTPFHRRRESYEEFRPFVTGLRAQGRTGLFDAVTEFLRERRSPGVTILISDFLLEPGEFEDALGRLSAARHELKVLHVMGEQESQASYPPGLYRIRDTETGAMREVAFGPALSEACRRKVNELCERLREYCLRHAIVYAPAFGARNLETILERELPKLGVVR